jgi:acetyl-CoA synthetase
MRRLLRDIAEGRTLGDTTTLADPNVVSALRDQLVHKIFTFTSMFEAQEE